MPDKVDKLYDNLKEDGWVENSRENFREYFLAPGEQGYKNRKALYDNMKEDGYVDSPTYEEFAKRMGLVSKQSQQKVSQDRQAVVDNARSTIVDADKTASRIGNRQQRIGLDVPQGGFGRVDLGQNRKVTPGRQRFNPASGTMEQTYITEAGNEYGTRAEADLEQNTIDEQRRRELNPVGTELEDAYLEGRRLESQIAELEGKKSSALQENNGFVTFDDKIFTDEDRNNLMSLEAASDMNQKRIRTLEAQRDDDGGTQFWRGFYDAFRDPSTYTFGITDLRDMIALSNIKSKIDQAKKAGAPANLTSEEESLLQSTMLNNDAESRYGSNRGFMYRAGSISMQALPFVGEFFLTGGFSAISQAGAKLGAGVAEKMALKGLGKTVVKNTGVALGDVAAGWAMANTTGAAKTASNIMERHIGQADIDENGEYTFTGGKSLGRSIYEGEVSQTLEYYTELLGNHLQLGKWASKGLERLGLTKLSKGVNYLSSSKVLQRGGIQDYPSEVMEEEANIFLNSLLVGDNQISDLWDKDTQLDIWGGMAFSIGLMQSPRFINSGRKAAGYYGYKYANDVADINAQQMMPDTWPSLKEKIDGTVNQDLPGLLGEVISGDMSDKQKEATMYYADSLLKMRGYNTALMADLKNDGEEPAESVLMSQALDKSYQDGHDTEDPDIKKQLEDDLTAAEQNLPVYGDEFAKLVTDSEDPAGTMGYLMQNRDYFTDEQIQAAADFFQKRQAVVGMLDGVDNRVDLQIAQQVAQARANTHEQTGNIISAQGADGQPYFVVAGELAQDEDGNPVIAGTGGAAVVKNAETGEVSVMSPSQLSVVSIQAVDNAINDIETNVREQLTQQEMDDISFGSPASEVYDLEDTVTIQDDGGNTIDGMVVSVPNAIDGVYAVQTSDNKVLQLTADDLNRRIVAHNGQEIQRNGNISQENIPDDSNIPGENIPDEQITDQAQEQPAEQQPEVEKPQRAIDRIPVLTDENGQPVLNKKGRPTYQWHQASVDDAADALIETTAGDMVMARDTAFDMVRNSQDKLEKIRKQKPKGDDPIEIAESRQEIQAAINEQQAIIKQWQDVGSTIKRRLDEEHARRQAEVEALKSADQKAREAEEQRIRKEKQDAADRQRIREQIEKDKEKRNKVYEPLAKAREELKDDPEALALLQDVEPRNLEEWVSSLIRPHSMLWLDASDSEIGLQSELGLKRNDMQRMMTLLGTKDSGAKPFGAVVLDIHELLPDAMKEMYSDDDVRNTLLSLFGEGSSQRMMHLTEENHISEARQLAAENRRRDQEAEMEAWAEAYHLTPEERETFEDFLQQQPMDNELDIYQFIADNEQNSTSDAVDGDVRQDGAVGEAEGGESEVLQEVEAPGPGDHAQGSEPATEAVTDQPTVTDNAVPGTGVKIVKPVNNKAKAGRMEKALTKAYASGDTAAIQKAVDTIKEWVDQGGDFPRYVDDDLYDYDGTDPKMLANQYIERILLDRTLEPDEDQEYINTGMRADMRQESAGTSVTEPQMRPATEDDLDNRPDAEFYHQGKRVYIMAVIHHGEQVSATQFSKPVVSSIMLTNGKSVKLEDLMVKDTAVIGKTSSPEEIATEEAKVDQNPTDGQKEAGNYQKGHIKIDGYDVTIENPKGSKRRGVDQNGKAWEQIMNNTYGYIRGTEGVDGDHIDVFLSDNPRQGDVFVVDQVNPENGEFDEHKVMYGFTNVDEAREAYLSNYEDGWQGLGNITGVSKEDFKKWVESSHRKTKPFAEYAMVKAAQVADNTEQAENYAQKPDENIPAEPKNEPKRLVSDDRMEELRKRLRSKLGGQATVGVDPEVLAIGAEMAIGYIERGVTKFADYAKAMIDEVGDFMRPYLKSFYNAVRDMPEAQEYADQMDDYQTVSIFDVFGFDKQVQPTAIEKADQVVKENTVKRQTKKIRQQQPDLFGDLFAPQEETKPQARNNEPKRPSLDKKDYKTYMTPEAVEYFASQYPHAKYPRLAFVTAASMDGVIIPVEVLKALPEIIEAEKKLAELDAMPTLVIHEKRRALFAKRLLDNEHGSAVMENGKVKDFTGPVRREKKAFIVTGRPAGGKSTVFANPLSYQHGARIMDSDTVKPWLPFFNDGYGSGYTQEESTKITALALNIAIERGENIVYPRIGGRSVMREVMKLREKGYDVQIYFNDIPEDTSIMRAASRFAQTGRYLSLDYLTSIGDKSLENFCTFVQETIGNYYDEIQQVKRSDDGTPARSSILGSGVHNDVGSRQHTGAGSAEIPGVVPEGSGSAELPEGGGSQETGRTDSLIFSYAEWKSNDVLSGQEPIEVWNSASGNPLPLTDEIKRRLAEYTQKQSKSDDNGRHEQRLSGESESGSQGAREESERPDTSGEGGSPEQDRPERAGSGRAIADKPAKRQDPHKNRRNNSNERGKEVIPTSPKARFNANVEAIKMMRALVEDGVEVPTQDQMEVLRQFSGWGGLGQYFNDERSAETKILHEILTDEEFNDAALSIYSAYYTPVNVIDTLWDIAQALGYKGGKVLEGSAGIGNILGQMPRDISRYSDIEAVEIDPITGNILRLLYPDAKVHIQGFQDTLVQNNSVDLAITNVPFVTGRHVIDKADKDLSRRFKNVHDFCIAKNIRKLSEGGIGIFITSSGTLDKSNDLRGWITNEGMSDVVGAFRLNNATFGGTKVTSDIVVVRKRINGIPSPHAIDISKASAVRVGSYTDRLDKEHQVTMVVNDYFQQHPEQMAGKMLFNYEDGDTFRPGGYGLYPMDNIDQNARLAAFVMQMAEAKETPAKRESQTATVDPHQLTEEKEGRMLIDDKGRLCISRRGFAEPLPLNDQKVKGRTRQECFKDYQAVQMAVDDVLQQQLNSPDDQALQPKLDALNKAYDLFKKRYGNLHKNTAISFLRNDVDFPSFQALEEYREVKDINGKVTVYSDKSLIFRKRVLGFQEEPAPKNVSDAVTASLFRTGSIDVPWIAEKLGETADEVRSEIISSRLGYEDPTNGQIEINYKYLSGNVREKLSIAEEYNTDGRYATNVEDLRKAVPMDIPAHLIDFSLGSSWIPVEIYQDYLKDVYDLDNVKMVHIEGGWSINDSTYYRGEKNRAAGVYSEKFHETIYGHQLVFAAMNNKPFKVAKQVTEGWGSNKKTRTEVDQKATQACAVRIDEIKDDFKQWVRKHMQENPDLAQRIEKIYNEKFNALVPMEIKPELMPEIFEGANINIRLYDHQKVGVMRGVTSPTMLAHEVGTGKSFTLLTTAMEMRRLGTAKKPMLVVQNATVAQITADAKLLYPNAKILSLTERDRDAEGRRAFYAKIKYNDWDIIVIPQSTFERIPDSPERERQFIQEKIDEKKHLIELAEQNNVDDRDLKRMRRELDQLETEYGDNFLDNDPANGGSKKKKEKSAKERAEAMNKAETRAKEMLDRATDDVQYFDDLGVDALLVDEAHEYKHLGFQTSIGRGIKGIDPSYSKKCAGLYNKTRCVFEKAGWKNVVFATGTPISNTAAEIWTFMKYLMPADVMRQNDIYYFDDFVHNFGSIAQSLEFQTNGKFREVTRFSAYVNKPELIRIWSQVAHTVLTKEVAKVQEKIPELEGGKDQDVFLKQSQSLMSIMASVREELERFENMTGQQKKENSSIPLVMFGIAKRAAIDPRLVMADAPDEPLSKTNSAVSEILKDLKATDSYKGTVAVFCDNQNRLGGSVGGKKVVEFNIFDEMRDKLIANGVPAGKIAIIKSGMTITAKQKIFDAVNSGDIRVIMGSTQTLGTGVNIQERLHLAIHMDAPDRPMDYTQRNGRIKRQGNLHRDWNKTIKVLRFGVEDSLDVTAYQRLKTKSGFIDSIMDGKAALANNQADRTVEEEEEGVFDNPVAMLSGSQYALKKNQAERELRKYRGKLAQYEADQIYVANTLRRDASLIDSTKEDIEEEKRHRDKIKSLFPDGKPKTVTVEGVKVDMTKDDAAKKLSDTIKEKVNDPVNAVIKRNRENPIYNDETLQFTVAMDGHDIQFKVSVYRKGEWKDGKMRTVIHKNTSYNSPDLQIGDTGSLSDTVKDFVEQILAQVITGQDMQDRIDAMQARIERLTQEREQLQKRVGLQFEYSKELEEAQKRVDEYTELMRKEMEEKEAKYATQKTEKVDLSKAEDEEEDDLYRIDDEEDEDPVFFSNAMYAVEGISQEKATPEQWLAMITKNGGLKAGEDKWLGLSDWLKSQDKKSLTRQEVMDYIRKNQIQVEDVNYAEFGEANHKKMAEFNEELRQKMFEAEETANLTDPSEKADWAFEQMVDKYGDDFRDAFELERGFRTDDWYLTPSMDMYDEISAEAEYFLGAENTINSTRLGYTTQGLDNKKEIALVVPTIEPYNEYDDIHFGDAGGGRAVAWVRFGDTTDKDGKRILVIDEIQSKRHQDARDKGYRKDAPSDAPALVKYEAAKKAHDDYLASLREKYGRNDVSYGLTKEEEKESSRLWSERFNAEVDYNNYLKENSLGAFSESNVPDAPFAKNWHELAMKRMLRYAAEHGYDKIAWTTGEQQAERYNIGNTVNEIRWINDAYYNSPNGLEKTKEVILRLSGGDSLHLFVNTEGTIEHGTSELKGKSLSEVVGKEIANKIMENEGELGSKYYSLSGEGLRIGGEGMKGFYDQILPRFMDKYGKKWGVKVGEVELPKLQPSAQKMWSVDVTPDMKASVMKGQPMFRSADQFYDGQAFPIRIGTNQSTYSVLGFRSYFETDLMPGDAYTTQESLLDAVREHYPEYYATIEDNQVVMHKWDSVLSVPTTKAKGTSDYVQRKTQRAIDAVNTMANRMHLDVEVLTSLDGLTGKKARAKGWFNRKTHKIVIVLPNHVNQSDVINTLLHEGVAHYGLRNMFGNNFDTFLDNVYNNVDPEIRNRIDASIKAKGWSRHEATEEYLARLAERTDFERALSSGWWQKIKDFFLEMLGQAGFSTSLSDNDLRYILWRSYDNLVHPDSRRTIFDTAKEVQARNNLGISRSVGYGERLQPTGKVAEQEPDNTQVHTGDFSGDDDIRYREADDWVADIRKRYDLKGGAMTFSVNNDADIAVLEKYIGQEAAELVRNDYLDPNTSGSYLRDHHLAIIFPGKCEDDIERDLTWWHEQAHVLTDDFGLEQYGEAAMEWLRDHEPNYYMKVRSYDRQNHQREAIAHFAEAMVHRYGAERFLEENFEGTGIFTTLADKLQKGYKYGREEEEGSDQSGRDTRETTHTNQRPDLNHRERKESAIDHRIYVKDVAQQSYNETVAKKSLQYAEAWQDSMIGVKAIQDAIAKETGRVATGAEDAYHYENRMHGRAKNMTEQYDFRFYRPMLKAFSIFAKRKNLTDEQAMDYLIAKSGLERNVYYAFRDGMREKIAEEVNKSREQLEKEYAKGKMQEADYKRRLSDLEERSRTGVDDEVRKVRSSLAYKRAGEDYRKGDISYTEYLRRIESLIRSNTGRFYDEHVKDYSGLTETLAKELYDEAQNVKHQAQRAVDPVERKMLWAEYDRQMYEAYKTARQIAEDAVFACEDGAVTEVSGLWDKINASTKETLRHSYESGLIDRKTYDKVGDMFDYYIPLRGWEEDKAADVYTYMGKDNVFSPAVKKTWGRTSKAENPLAYIGNIAVSTILSGHRNLMKQHFLNYVMNNPTSLVSISESWYENIAEEGDAPIWILRTADTAGKTADEIVQIVNDFNEEMAAKAAEGRAMPVRGRLRLDVNATKGQKSEHVVEVQRAGHTYQLYINGDPKAAQALNGTHVKAVSRISDTYLGQKITSINRAMAAYFTSKNPAFVLSNLSRDMNMAGASIAIKEGAEYNMRFLENVAKVMSPRVSSGDISREGVSALVKKGKGVTGLMPKLMTKWQTGRLNMSNETERLFKEFMDEGGETGFVNMLSVDSFKRKMENEIRQMNGSALFGGRDNVKETTIHHGLRILGDTFEFYNRCAEDATRFIVYMTSRQMGKSLEASIADAKDVTLNFNRKGTGGKGNAEVRDLFIFVNPAIQALANMYKMATGRPLKFGAVTSAFVAGGALMPIINQWLINMFGDDDDKNAYYNLPPWVRKNNFVLYIPGTSNFVTIPLAQEFRVFYGVGEMMSSAVMDHPVSNVGLEVVSSVADLVPINPTGNGGNLMVDFAPTGVQPLMQIGENIDFTGRPIWRENQGNAHAPMYTKAYITTPAWMVKVSEKVNDLTGGNEGKKGFVEKNLYWGEYINNPAVWNHLLQGYFGGMYNTIAKTFDVGVTAAKGEIPKIYQTPIINRFLNRPVERDNAGVLGDDYHSLIEERDALAFELRTWKKKAADGDESAQQHIDEILQSSEYQRSEVITHYEKILQDLKAGERAAVQSADKADIKRTITLYKQQMIEEIAAIDDGKDPVEAAMEAFDKTSSWEEKNRLRMRIERLMARDTAPKKPKSRTEETEKALRYITEDEAESRNVNERYLSLASAENVRDDARIRAARQKIKTVTDEYKRLQESKAYDKAERYRESNAKYFTADHIIRSQSAAMAQNKKMLGQGHDQAVMRLIDINRRAMIRAIPE